MGTPKYLLLVREDDMKTFFEENKTFDNKTSFLGTYMTAVQVRILFLS